MWIYEKKLQYPIRIKNPDPRMAQVILTQYGGPDGKCLSGGKRQLCARKCRLVSNLMLANTKVFASILTHYCNKLAFLGRMVFGSLMPVPTQSSQYPFFRAFGKHFCRRSNPLQLYLYG